MSNRNNGDRTGPQNESSAPVAATVASPLDFVTPKELVDLPSKGALYQEGHPLCGKEDIEIRFMTAKEEDILTSRSLLKKGTAIDHFLQSIITDKNIKVNSLLIGDKNAILIAARASGYGSDYETQVMCPACSAKSVINFDLNNRKIKESTTSEELNIRKTENNTFMIKMPYSKFDVEIRPLTGEHELYLSRLSESRKKGKQQESAMTDQYKMMIQSVQGNSAKDVIKYYVENMPLKDSRYLRNAYKVINPDVKITEEFQCQACDYEQEMEVPFGADFLWPDR